MLRIISAVSLVPVPECAVGAPLSFSAQVLQPVNLAWGKPKLMPRLTSFSLSMPGLSRRPGRESQRFFDALRDGEKAALTARGTDQLKSEGHAGRVA
jgi:hypothetical protein